MTMKINSLVKKLATTKTGHNLFNPYNQLCKNLDDKTAPGVRQQNLRLYLNTHIVLKTKMLWIYYSPSFEELKRSGIPLGNLNSFNRISTALSTSRQFESAIKSKNKIENTLISKILLNITSDMNINPVIWPVIPFYPHKKGNLMDKRKIDENEIIKYGWVLKDIIEIFKPTDIVSIGKDAYDALQKLGIKSINLNHPRSGKEKFKKNIKKLYKI